MQFLNNLDYKIFLDLNRLSANHAAFLMYSFLADKLAYIMGASLILLWFIGKPRLRARKAVASAVVAFVVARLILVELIRHFWHRPRPFIAHQVAYLFKRINEDSFPSGHASAMFAISMAVYMYNRKWGIYFFTLSVLTGVARIIVGEHYPLDIIGGTILGMLTGWVIVYLIEKKRPFTKSN